MSVMQQIREWSKALKDMPFLLKLACEFSACGVVLAGIFFVIGILNVILGLFTPHDQQVIVGNFRINDQQVTFRDWKQTSILFLLLVGLGAWTGTITYGLVRKRQWVRHLIMGSFLLLFVLWVEETVRSGYSNTTSIAVEFVVTGGLAAFSAWYLYSKKNVEAYFNAAGPSHSGAAGAA